MLWIPMILIAFLCGSIPFSVWLGKLFLNVDVRQYGDGNPGAANVFRAGNKVAGLIALLLDVAKAAAPVGFSYFNLGIHGIPMYLISIAPMLGHAFSPFLKFHGGKAIAVSLGVWIGLSVWKASLAGVVGVVIGIVVMSASAWAVMLGLLAILITLLIWIPDPLFLMVWVSQTLLLIYTHRFDLRQKPRLRPWLTSLLLPRKK